MHRSRRIPLRLILLLSALSLAGPARAADEAPADTTESAPLDLTPYQGQVVYLDFWASWCAPCKRSFPWMIALQDELSEEGLAVVTVNVDRDRAAAERFLEQTESDLEVIYDPEGEVAEAYGLEAMPSSFVYDRNGELRATHVGFHPEKVEEVEAELRELLAEEVDDAHSD